MFYECIIFSKYSGFQPKVEWYFLAIVLAWSPHTPHFHALFILPLCCLTVSHTVPAHDALPATILVKKSFSSFISYLAMVTSLSSLYWQRSLLGFLSTCGILILHPFAQVLSSAMTFQEVAFYPRTFTLCHFGMSPYCLKAICASLVYPCDLHLSWKSL